MTDTKAERWMCMLCGRDKFARPGEPHQCAGGFRKRFKAAAKRRGIDNAFVRLKDHTCSACGETHRAMEPNGLCCCCHYDINVKQRTKL